MLVDILDYNRNAWIAAAVDLRDVVPEDALPDATYYLATNRRYWTLDKSDVLVYLVPSK
jgi:hypothetical protein